MLIHAINPKLIIYVNLTLVLNFNTRQFVAFTFYYFLKIFLTGTEKYINICRWN